jgi:hypothetical protein
MKKVLGISGVLLALTGCAQFGNDRSAPPAKAEIPITANRYWVGDPDIAEGETKNCRPAGYITPVHAAQITFPTLNCPGTSMFVRNDPAVPLNASAETKDAGCAATNAMAVQAFELGTPEFNANGRQAVMSSRGLLKPGEVPIPQNMVGTWRGKARTANGSEAEIYVDLSRAGLSTTRYIELKCESDLYLTGGATANVGFTEVNDQKGSACDAKTLVAFSLSDSKTLLRKAYSPVTGEIISEATLAKAGN